MLVQVVAIQIRSETSLIGVPVGDGCGLARQVIVAAGIDLGNKSMLMLRRRR